MRKPSIKLGFQGTKILLQRSALIFFILALIFGLFEPGASRALAALSTTKTFKTDYKLEPLKSPETQPLSPLTEVPGESLDSRKVENPRGHKYEETSERTPFTSTYVNNDGTRTLKYSLHQQNYLEGKTWKKLDNKLSAIEKEAPKASFWQNLTGTQPKAPAPDTFTGKAGVISAEIKPLSEGVVLHVDGKTITMRPVGANENVKPEQRDDSSIVYRDAWPNVDLEYELRGESVKEIIVVKSKEAQTTFNFKIGGGKVVHHPTQEGKLALEGMSNDFSFSSLTLDVYGQGVISEQRVSQQPSKAGDGIVVTMDRDWMKSQPKESFPMRIDPTYVRDETERWVYKSDGYSCTIATCYANIGTLSNNGWKSWRSYFHFPYSNLAGKKILDANVHGAFKAGIGGDTNWRSIAMGHAPCLGYWCQGAQVGATTAATDFDIKFTAGLQQAIDAGNFGAVWSFWGEEGAYKSYKPYWDLLATVVYDTPTPMTTPVAPSNKQVVVDTQPILSVNPVSDADGDTVKYYFRVSTNADAETGAVINSGWISSLKWTIPDGILQDGTTYYWHTYTMGALQTDPNWVRSFKVDFRTGKDSTQSYETVGPVGIDLATGNATFGASTHDMSALGGSMGLSLTYNTPNRAKKGLKGEYWNIASGYNFANGAPTSTPTLVRRDQNINFDWGTSSPASINSDWFYARWTGQFVAPTSGTYKFGANNDDTMKVIVDNQELYNQYCPSGVCYDESKSIALEAGQAVSLHVEYIEKTVTAQAKLYVKGAVSQQIIPGEWLRTSLTNESRGYGLTGRYYVDTGDKNVDTAAADPSRLMMIRQDTNLNLQFGTGGPAQGMRTDNFLVRWTGYITVPKGGAYKLGFRGDDGARIKIKNGSSWTTVLDSWSYTNTDDRWGSAATLAANTPIPVVVDFREATSAASFTLRIQDPAGTPMTVPATWLTPNASILPDQWSLGIDAKGGASYERLRMVSQSVILEDSTGSTHEYTYTSGGYKPPVNENGTLLKNTDNTFTFIDTDGRIYIFDASGKLTSLTSPADDRQPAALKYTYAGDPSRLVRIEDGTTSTRYATVYYKDINEEGNICDKNGTNNPSGFLGLSPSFTDAPAGMLCAFKTSDGAVTNFYYDDNGNLARIVQPGGQITDYAYDGLGRITAMRDPLAADVIGAGVRSDNETVTTQLYYDGLGRISSIKPPSATDGVNRPEHTFSYRTSKTDMHITGASEPNGYSRRIQYDSLLRTIAETDLTGKSVLTEWDSVKDLRLSTTDATGLKSTTVYDDDDRPVYAYGPAPAAWYASNRTPLSTYASQVPSTSTFYDRELKGPAVTWYNLKSSNMTFVGAAKAYTTGFASNNAPELGNPAYLRHDFREQALPFTVDSGFEGYGFTATGKLRFAKSGTYTFTASTDDSVRLFIDDRQVFSNWGTKTTGSTRNTLTATLALDAGKAYRFTYQYGHEGMSDLGSMGLDISGLGITGNTRDWSPFLQPGYNLTTNTAVYDSQLGDITSTTQYSNPAYGLLSSITLDPTGLNYQSTATYEALGTGYLRQTSKTLPGGAMTVYQHYEASDTRDNPCTSEVEVIHQGARPKGKIDADPDGDGPQVSRTSETIYDHTGRTVANRFNQDPWTCITYDARGRTAETSIPAHDSKPGRTINNNYAVNGNPLVTSTSDSSGTIVVKIDLLGRTVEYTDVHGFITANLYDIYGKLDSRTSILGTETFTYDTYDRMTVYKVDNIALATITYDQYSRIQTIQYPEGISLEPAQRDALDRVSKVTYKVGDKYITDEITRSVSGVIATGIENGVDKSYTYDKASRLTQATIGNDSFTYEFGVPDIACNAISGINPTTAKNSNRTKLIKNGQVTTYCYDYADRLVDSSDLRFSAPTYDSHGNTVTLGAGNVQTSLEYDVSDRNTVVTESTKRIEYARDVSDRIIERISIDGASTTSHEKHVYSGGASSPTAILDANNVVIAKYLSLPGGVNVKINPQSTSAGAATYSLSNFHGDTMATVNADGSLTGTYITGPFGEQLEQTVPANATTNTTYNYVGKYQKITESSLSVNAIQMGARVYIPELGRFMSVDPVEGGTLNNYAYVMDPVNQSDLNGEFAQVLLIPVILTVNWGAVAAYAGVAVAGAAVGIAAGVAASNAISNARSKAQTNTKVQTVPPVSSRGYTQAPGYPGTKMVDARAANATAKNAAIASVIGSLHNGFKPGGFPIIGEGAGKPFTYNPMYFSEWTKYSIPYPALNFEVHYSINESKRWYSDVKVKKSYGGN